MVTLEQREALLVVHGR